MCRIGEIKTRTTYLIPTHIPGFYNLDECWCHSLAQRTKEEDYVLLGSSRGLLWRSGFQLRAYWFAGTSSLRRQIRHYKCETQRRDEAGYTCVNYLHVADN